MRIIQSVDFIHYKDALLLQEKYVEDVQNKGIETVWFLEHFSVYTAGTGASELDHENLKVDTLKTGRGGKITYHGPGQRVIYLFLDLNKREKDLKKLVWNLEEWIIQTLLHFNIVSFRVEKKPGIWVFDTKGSCAKIAALGVRVSKWITSHGIALNVHPDLSFFDTIVPCGIKEGKVTSLKVMGKDISLNNIDNVLLNTLRNNQFLWKE